MTLNINQFAISSVQGQLDLQYPGTVISCEVDAAQSGTLVAGQAVKLATTTGGVPKVIGLAANTDITYGFVARNQKDADFSALDSLEIAQFNTCVWMTAGAAITRGASVEVVYTTNKVITSAGTNPVVGYAFDAAAADGDLIRVIVQAPYSAPATNLTQREQVITVSATLAEINAGKVLIPGVTGQKITVTNYAARVVGTFTTGTAIVLESTNGTPVVVTTIAEAALGTGALNLPSSANNTLGAGFAAQLGTSDGLQVVNSGSNQAGGTSVSFTITYKQA